MIYKVDFSVRLSLFQRAMENQDTQRIYATSLWEHSQQTGQDVAKTDLLWGGQIDSSKIDPIWDGTVNPSSTETTLNKHFILSKVGPTLEIEKSLWDSLDKETSIEQECDNCIKDIKRVSDENKKEIKLKSVHEGQMKKVPSGFWEIDLSELGIDINMASTRSSTLL